MANTQNKPRYRGAMVIIGLFIEKPYIYVGYYEGKWMLR